MKTEPNTKSIPESGTSSLQAKLAAWADLPLRLGLGVVMAAHGAQKLFGWFGGYGLQGTAGFFADNLGLKPGLLFAFGVGAIEFFGGLLLLAGLFTRWAALAIAIVMAGAILTVHGGAFFAPEGMEFPLVLMLSSLALFLLGSRRLALEDQLFANARRSEN